MANINVEMVAGSFRDPSGFVFRDWGEIYRQVNLSYKENYDHLMESGLYSSLVNAQALVTHEEVQGYGNKSRDAYLVIKPNVIPFISYPYEWCFSQLKAAALTTLEIQKEALEYGMSLKDCSAYNIQFIRGRPILIDTLSFERYMEGRPWVALRQFCQHFLAPLALMSYKDVRLNQLLRIYIDGIPLDLASSLLPWRSWLSPALLSFIHLHSKSQKYYADKSPMKRNPNVSRRALLGFIDSLQNIVRSLEWRQTITEWSAYYENPSYSDVAFDYKKTIVSRFLERVSPKTVWDLGANVGIFSRLAAGLGALTISMDADPAAVERNYTECLETKETNVLALLIDLTNPSAQIGWANEERMSLVRRGPADACLALALIHHLAISNNLPLDRIAPFLASTCKYLIIEFVPKDDPQVQRLLASREDIFPNYGEQEFERAFVSYFRILDSQILPGCSRKLYLMENVGSIQ